jgi:hypothetical protein
MESQFGSPPLAAFPPWGATRAGPFPVFGRENFLQVTCKSKFQAFLDALH